MKKIYITFLILLSLLFIDNVKAIGISSSPNQAYLSSESTIFKIMNDSDTTCSSYLESINYDIYSQLGHDQESYFIDLHYNSSYTSGESFQFTEISVNDPSVVPYLEVYSSSSSIETIRLVIPHKVVKRTYKMSCTTGKVEQIGETDYDQASTYNLYILERRGVGYEFFPSYYQSNFGDVNFRSSDGSIDQNQPFQLVGVYDNNLSEVQKIDDFIGSDYYSNNLVLGSGVGLIPFYSALSGDFNNVDIPYTDQYNYWYLNVDSTLFFVPKETFNDENVDTSLYIRPVILDQTLSTEQLLNIFGSTEIKLGVYQDYQNIKEKLMYSYYWNNSYNDFFIIDSSKLTSTNGMYQLVFNNLDSLSKLDLNQMVVYFDPNAWNVSQFNTRTNQNSVTLHGVSGDAFLYRNDIINSRTDLLKDNNIQNKPQYGNTSGDNPGSSGGSTSFFDGLLNSISGISNFISSISSGISVLTDSITSIISLAFTTLNSLPLPVSSLFYLTFLLTMVAIILKIFL